MFEQARMRGWVFLAAAIALLMLTRTSAQTTTWYVAKTGSNSSSCGPQNFPCASLSYVLSNKVQAGHKVIVGPGEYTEGTISLSGSRHQNVTITTTPAVISALGTFNRGIPTGTDNRPYFSRARVDVAASGVTLSYLRIRQSSSGFDGAYDGVVGVSATGVTVSHNEIWNGNQGVVVEVKRQVTVTQNHIHNLGSMSSSEDTHGVSVCGTGTMASGFSEAITISENSIHDVGGDGVQENTDAYCSGTLQYLIIANNNLYNNQEQGFDSKGTQDLRFYGNDVYENREGGIVATDDPNVVNKVRWEISGNRFHDHDDYAIMWAQNPDCGAWLIYDNLFYNNVRRPQYNYAAVHLCGDSASMFHHNVLYNNTDSGSTHTAGVAAFRSRGNVVNNIFYNNGIGGDDYGNIRNVSGEDSGTPRYNYIYPASKGSMGSNVVSTCLTTNNCPGFVNIAGRDFRLVSNSPAINKGLTLATAFILDFAGAARGQNGAWDLGAFEFGGTPGQPPSPPATGAPAAPTNLRIVP